MPFPADVVVLSRHRPSEPDRTTTLSGKKRRRRAPSATPWDGTPERDLNPAERAVMRSSRSIYDFRHHDFEGDSEFYNGYPRDSCPHCGSPQIARKGKDRDGLQRYSCKTCGRYFSPVTGTIFEDAKLPVSAWADFVLQAVSFESVNAMTREDRRSDTTAPYWMAKLFAVLEGIQDGVVLSGRVWIDEAYWPLAAEDAAARPDGKLPRGTSKNQLCIGVGVDDSGRSTFIHEGFGRANGGMTRKTFGEGRIARGSTLTHDCDQSHLALVRELSLVDVRVNASKLKGVPDELHPLQPVNRMCYFLKTFLKSHSGFKRSQIQGYLDLLYVAMNEPEDKLEKVAMVLDRAMRRRKTIRFRDFYKRKPSSSDCADQV